MSLQCAVSPNRGFVAPAPSFEHPWTTSPMPDGSGGNGAAQNGSVRRFLSDGAIYDEGDEAKSFYKFVSGVLPTCRSLSDGRRQIEAFHVAGDVFGLESGTERRLSAEAVSDCTLISCRRLGLEKTPDADSVLTQQLFSFAMQCVVRARDHSLMLRRSGAAQKVAAFLLEVAHR